MPWSVAHLSTAYMSSSGSWIAKTGSRLISLGMLARYADFSWREASGLAEALAIPAHEEADEESDGEANSSSRIGTLFYRRANNVVSLSGTLARSLERISCGVLGLAVEVLHSTL